MNTGTLVMLLYLTLGVLAVVLSIWLYKKGYKRGQTGVRMNNKNYILCLMFIGAYAYGYNKGMQDYLLGNKKR